MMSEHDYALPVMLTVAGSDPGGGAGLQADIRTAMAAGVYCTSAVTCITVQNSHRFSECIPVDADIVRRQIDSVIEDHFLPRSPGRSTLRAVKIGMLPDYRIARAVRESLIPLAGVVPIVFDPILAPTLGNDPEESRGHDECIAHNGRMENFAAELAELSAMAYLSTPNMEENALLSQYGGLKSDYILKKGGHAGTGGESVDILFKRSAYADSRSPLEYSPHEYIEIRRYSLPQIDTCNTHGTGCVLSSAIAANLAGGLDIEEAIEKAKRFLHERLALGACMKFGAADAGDSVRNYGPAFMV